MIVAHEAMKQAFKSLEGLTLSKEEIVFETKKVNPNLKDGSIMPSDVDDFARLEDGHGESDWKRDYPILLSRLGGSNYLILPVAERKYFASSKSGRGGKPKTAEELQASIDAKRAKQAIPASE